MLTRLARESDYPPVGAFHARCSPESLHSRYLSGRRDIRLPEWRRLIDPAAGWTWVSAPEQDPGRVVAVSHVLRVGPGDSATGELGILVEDGWQGQRLGSQLTRAVLSHSLAHGLNNVVIVTNGTNVRMVRIGRALGAVVPRVFSPVIEMTLTSPDRRDGA
ncbi:MULTISPECIES: GNAT family N-acetyltransferase [Streptomyces]|uniref:GNAT family N-acetyltransferase n=1 Tax=Streptomyces TaxID=1883 RepID=UPI00240D2AD1|nr:MULTISPECIES: GNAT family N-acetyltransferase [Streptomyces]WFB88453.1 GNAT family N-acetyltransferase [Streptomyces olivaceus]WGK50896.1 GNAT family N-acetyltransferase [Streptomyces sp. B146]